MLQCDFFSIARNMYILISFYLEAAWSVVNSAAATITDEMPSSFQRLDNCNLAYMTWLIL